MRNYKRASRLHSKWLEADIQQMAKNCTANEEDAAKVIHEFEEIIKNKKSDMTTKVKYFRSSDQKNDLLTIWF